MPKIDDDSTLVVGLDIGTNKVCALVGAVDANGNLYIAGAGTHPSKGMKKGVITNIDSTIQAIQNAVQKAEVQASCDVHSINTSISGNHIRSLNSDGVIPIANQEVTLDDIYRVMESAQAVAIPADQKILHVLPQEFEIDGHGGIRDPIGMAGVRMEARVHIITCAVSALTNLIRCIEKCKLAVDEVVLQPIAAARAVLTDDEKELGVCLIDIGAGTTDIAVFVNGFISHTASLPIAGDQITNDIAVVQRISTQLAEKIKIEHGCCLTQLVRADEMIDIPTVSEQSKRLSRQSLAQVIESRYEELFTLVQEELRKSGYEHLIGAGIVLSGGSSNMQGVVELAEEIFHLPVRIGLGRGVTGMAEIIEDPSYAAAIGLLIDATESYNLQKRQYTTTVSESFFSRIKRTIIGNF